MVVDSPIENCTDRVFHALADPTRRDILRRSLRSEHSVSALATYYPMSFAAVQKHVAVLERAELVRKTKRGREQLVGADARALEVASRVLDQFALLWRERLDRFGDVLHDDR